MSELDYLRSLPFDVEAPADAARSRARGRLLSHFRRAPRRRRLLAPAVVLTVAALAAVLIDSALQGGGSASAAPALRKAATVAGRQAPPAALKAGQFRYTKSVQAYLSGGKSRDGRPWEALGPRVREIWLGPSGGLLHEVSGKPEFLSAADRRNWIAAGRPEVNAAEATEKLPPPRPLDLPSDPDALYAKLRARSVGNANGTEGEMFTLVGDALRETDASPALRAALYEVAARIPGVELVGPAKDRIGRRGVAVAYANSADHQRHQLIFDPKTSTLLEEDYVELDHSFYGYPPGTVTGYATYVATGVVDRLGVRP